MKGKILVSACLLGRKCRFDGGDSYDSRLAHLLKGFEVVGIYPEELSGFKGRRGPFEIIGRAKVVDINDRDVTSMFIKGAMRFLEVAREKGVDIAVLKSKSPSCSPDYVYEGYFRGNLIKGLGVSA